MTTLELVKSFKNTAKWSDYKDIIGRPISGSKWLTRKQVNFLHNLFYKEINNGTVESGTSIEFDGAVWNIDGYFVTLSKRAPNGCRMLRFELKDEVK